jgi:hypothetical protein
MASLTENLLQTSTESCQFSSVNTPCLWHGVDRCTVNDALKSEYTKGSVVLPIFPCLEILSCAGRLQSPLCMPHLSQRIFIISYSHRTSIPNQDGLQRLGCALEVIPTLSPICSRSCSNVSDNVDPCAWGKGSRFCRFEHKSEIYPYAWDRASVLGERMLEKNPALAAIVLYYTWTRGQ